MDLRTRRKRKLLFLWVSGYRWPLDQRQNKRNTGFYSRLSYCHPQISQCARERFSLPREPSTGGGRGCQSFQKGKARSQRSHAHTPTTGAWVIHERIFSVLEAQTLKTTIGSVIRRQSVICSFRICSFSWSAQGKSLMRGTPLIAPLRQPGTNKKWKACGDQHTSHPLGSEAKI